MRQLPCCIAPKTRVCFDLSAGAELLDGLPNAKGDMPKRLLKDFVKLQDYTSAARRLHWYPLVAHFKVNISARGPTSSHVTKGYPQGFPDSLGRQARGTWSVRSQGPFQRVVASGNSQGWYGKCQNYCTMLPWQGWQCYYEGDPCRPALNGLWYIKFSTNQYSRIRNKWRGSLGL